MSRGTWENKGRAGWEYTGHGWGVYGVQRTRNGWYAFEHPFSGSPVGIGMYGTRQEAQTYVEGVVARLVESKARKGNPVAKLIDQPKFAPAVAELTRAVTASQKYDKTLAKALAKYGDHGAQISGAGREHFPATVKDELRTLARSVTAHSDAAWRLRPSRVRTGTMRRLSSEVAKRHGSGFYGPRPNPSRMNKQTVPLWRVRGMGRHGPVEIKVRSSSHAGAMRTAEPRFVSIDSCVLVDSPRKRNPAKSTVDTNAARELVLYAENIGPGTGGYVYNQRVSIIENLRRKVAKGTYNHALAAKLWKYWMNTAAKEYTKEFGTGTGFGIFSAATREAAAREIADNLREEVMAGATRKNPRRVSKVRRKRRATKSGSVRARKNTAAYIVASVSPETNAVLYYDGLGRLDSRRDTAKKYGSQDAARRTVLNELRNISPKYRVAVVPHTASTEAIRNFLRGKR